MNEKERKRLRGGRERKSERDCDRLTDTQTDWDVERERKPGEEIEKWIKKDRQTLIQNE